MWYLIISEKSVKVKQIVKVEKEDMQAFEDKNQWRIIRKSEDLTELILREQNKKRKKNISY